MTAEEFAANHGGDYVELIDAVVHPIRPVGARNGEICGNLTYHFVTVLKESRAWAVSSNDTFVLTGRNPDRVRGADLVVWPRERMPHPVPVLIADPPTLVGEVRRPFDSPGDMIAKVTEYLAAGVRWVLALDPDAETIDVLRLGHIPQRFSNGGELNLGDVLPGFAVPVRRFFE
jgi:Uma2 family endonuclease